MVVRCHICGEIINGEPKHKLVVPWDPNQTKSRPLCDNCSAELAPVDECFKKTESDELEDNRK